MKINQVLNESMDFGVQKLIYTDEYPKGLYTWVDMEEYEEECWMCDGSGKSEYHVNGDCPICDGSGVEKGKRPTTPNLNVSNANGYAIQDMLGVVDPDYAGSIKYEELPALMRRLIKIKNTGLDKWTKDTKTSKDTLVTKDDETGLDKISSGPTMIDIGRDYAQVEHYIDRLLVIIQAAIKHKAALTWG